jgi:hypothetical protein
LANVGHGILANLANFLARSFYVEKNIFLRYKTIKSTLAKLAKFAKFAKIRSILAKFAGASHRNLAGHAFWQIRVLAKNLPCTR